MHDGRWTLGVAENGDVRLQDLKTGAALWYAGPCGLFDALVALAVWRDKIPDHSRDYGASCAHCPEPTTGPSACTGECGIPARTDNTQKSHYGVTPCGLHGARGCAPDCEGRGGDRSALEASGDTPPLQHKSDHDAWERVPSRVQARDEPCVDPVNCDVHRKSDHGATPSDEEMHALDHWNRGVVVPGCHYCDAQHKSDSGE
jgi:hypothetical protein